MTVSACLVLWVLLTALAPLWIPVAFLVGVVRRCSFVVLRLLMFFWVYLAIELMGLVAATGIYLITPRNIERRHGLFFSLECWWGGSLFDWLSRFLSLSTSIEGDEQILPGPVLVFMRHASLIDTALPVAFISRAKGLRLRYVFKRELLVDPCIDVAGHASPNYFIDRGGSAQAELAGVRKLADHLGDEGVLLYPEGTRFTERKKRIALKRLAKTHPELVTMAESFKHSLPPKAGGALTLLDAAPQADVLIVAHRGLEGLAEVTDLLSGAVVGQKVEIRIWRINAADIPQGEARRRWLFDWWKRVDDFVYAAG
ncbi:MAG: 1-acyl-sn-glycerol-3-phosphate acyltransferase [Deltaproteobacteria bacterium]|nr:1-acyl-sn-glycerol-3-phosphate acyltransferase [Deltaproteobacteria bacterium]